MHYPNFERGEQAVLREFVRTVETEAANSACGGTSTVAKAILWRRLCDFLNGESIVGDAAMDAGTERLNRAFRDVMAVPTENLGDVGRKLAVLRENMLDNQGGENCTFTEAILAITTSITSQPGPTNGGMV
jgi:hypothetical protein